MDKLTYEEFVKTRTFHPDGRVHPEPFIRDMFEGFVDNAQPILIYDGCAVIEVHTVYWPAESDCQYLLIISNQQYLSDNLEELEARLYLEWYSVS